VLKCDTMSKLWEAAARSRPLIFCIDVSTGDIAGVTGDRWYSAAGQAWASLIMFLHHYSVHIQFLHSSWMFPLNPLIATLKLQSNGPSYSNAVIITLAVDGWACYIWYSEKGTGRGRNPPRPLLTVPNVTAHPSTASVPTLYYSMWHYNCLWSLKRWMKRSRSGSACQMDWKSLEFD